MARQRSVTRLPPRAKHHVGYLLELRPHVPSACPLQEVAELKAQGERVTTFAAPEEESRRACVRIWKSAPVLLSPSLARDWRRAARAIWGVVKGRPRRRIRTLWGLGGHGSGRLRRLLHAVLLSKEMARRSVTHLHAPQTQHQVAALAAAISGIPYSILGTGEDPVKPADRRGRRSAPPSLGASFVVADDALHAQFLANTVDPPARVVVIRPGLERSLFALPLARQRDRGLVVALSPMIAGTLPGLLDTVRAVRFLSGCGIEVRLEVYGEGPERYALETVTDELHGLAVVKPARSHEQLRRALQRAAVCCVPGTPANGTAPGALLEAMAAATPLVGIGLGRRCLVPTHGYTGLRVRSGEPLALSDAIWRLLTDRGLAWRLAGRARLQAEQFAGFEQRVGRLRALVAATEDSPRESADAPEALTA